MYFDFTPYDFSLLYAAPSLRWCAPPSRARDDTSPGASGLRRQGSTFQLQIVAAGLKELAPRHICFELLRLDWLERLDMVDSTAPRDFQDLLPHKKISHLCSSIDTMQKQIKGLIAQVLDMDGEKKPVSEKMVAYYNTEGGDSGVITTEEFSRWLKES